MPRLTLRRNMALVVGLATVLALAAGLVLGIATAGLGQMGSLVAAALGATVVGAGVGLAGALWSASMHASALRLMTARLDAARLAPPGRLELAPEALAAEAPADEVGELIRASAALAARLAQDRAGQLERLVAERTAELQAALDELRRADRLKGDFLNAVSHELRTPLTAIRGFTEFLEDGIGGSLGPQQAHFVANIGLGVDQLSDLVNDLLDVARLDAGSFTLSPQAVDYVGLAETSLRQLRSVADRKGVALGLSPPSEGLEVYADPRRARQVLNNLVGNALKFTPAGGRIDVVVLPMGAEVRTEVVDTGPGIAPEHLDRLFTRFYQVDSSTTREVRGTGLGLAISKGLVEAMGGSIGVESRQGEGSRFWFTLPGRADRPQQLRLPEVAELVEVPPVNDRLRTART